MEIHPATVERWSDLCTVLNPRSDPRACWCLAYRLPSGEFGSTRAGEREVRMRGLVEAGPPPGLLAYLDGEVVGWCNVGPRTAMERLVRSRTIPAVDDAAPSPASPRPSGALRPRTRRPVWSVVCFVVRVGFRRQGIAEELLHGAVEYARSQAAPAIEGYPIDPAGKRVNTTDAFVGTAGMFERAGFRRVTKTAATSARLPRWLMRRDLTGY